MPEPTSSPPAPPTPPSCAAASLTAEPSLQRYLYPELEALKPHQRINGRIVAWAIQRMTQDYTLQDILRLVQRAGYRLRTGQISVVLTRWKQHGWVEEVIRYGGPVPVTFRKPENPIPFPASAADLIGSAVMAPPFAIVS